jgi:hypothetical protein
MRHLATPTFRDGFFETVKVSDNATVQVAVAPGNRGIERVRTCAAARGDESGLSENLTVSRRFSPLLLWYSRACPSKETGDD